MRAVGTWSMRRVSSSGVEGSLQCRSSTINSAGCCAASAKNTSEALPGFFVAAAAGSGQRWIMIGWRQRQQRGQQRYHLGQGQAILPRLPPACSASPRGIIALKLPRPFKIDEGSQGAILIMGEQRHSRWTCGWPAMCSVTTCTRRDLPIPASPLSATACHPLLNLCPAFQEQARVGVSPHEWGQPSGRCHAETCLHPAL